jgi:hypothetical protein
MMLATRKIALRPCTIVYLLLLAMTLFTWAVGIAGFSSLLVSLLVLGLSLVKGQMIGDYYMGLKWVNSSWRWLVTGWLLLPGILISLAFYTAG